MINLHQNITDFLELVFPTLCVTCGERLITQEKLVCFNCWNDLPVTHFHLEPENKVAQLFWGRVTIENAASYFSYRKGSKYQQLIHFTKYKGLKELGYETGRKYGFVLRESSAFCAADFVVPVPLHPKKEKKRGYNQCNRIAEGIAASMDKKVVADNLFRKTYTSTQTRKNRYERWQNVDGIFGIHRPEEFENKHLLLVDDVVTTGSTLEACAYEILKIRNTKVSIATLAFADF
ncbi:ComF family protein [Maribellus sediminis]|uniref:ComF family protein n=1 Tax=Maribellus sediminis TaxID=2696285 RepID=UPI00143179C0|nr:phosphoribosyltransferase family protein [Maribellus sediminis]